MRVVPRCMEERGGPGGSARAFLESRRTNHGKNCESPFIGAGRLGGFHAQKIAARDDLNFVGVVDPDPASRRRVAN